jgi:hypothetical protein
MTARAADPYRDTDVIDSRAPRFNQAVVGVVSVLAVLTGWWWLLALLAAQLAMAAGSAGRRSSRARFRLDPPDDVPRGSVPA